MSHSTVEYKGLTIYIEYDEDPMSPNDWDQMGKFYHWHSRYGMSADAENLRSWDDDEIKELLNDSIFVPVYMYDHSGVTINTTGFSCSWDSGQVGYFLVSKDKVKKEYGVKRISKQLKEKVEKILTSEVETWDQYYCGEVYGFRVLDSDGIELDSCWGFYGDEGIEQAIVEAKGFIDYRTSDSYSDSYKQPSLFAATA